VKLRRSLLVPTLCAALAVPLAAADGAVGVKHDDRVHAVPDPGVLDRMATPMGDKFTGTNGHEYAYAPLAVKGRKGWLYYGADFDNACSLGGPGLKKATEQLARTANIIRESGRRVIWTMAPNKSLVLSKYVKSKRYPHGECDGHGLAAQAKIMRDYDSPGYLPMLAPLTNSKHQTYWKTDPHWSTVGGAVFAKEVAKALNPRLGKIQRSHYGAETGVGALNLLRGVNTPETLERAYPATHVRVTQLPSESPWTGYPELTFDTSWETKPARKTWPGKTLIVGDSFSMFGLESLRPLFRHGRWMWFAHVAPQDLVQAIKEADTVVLEVFELYVPNSDMSAKEFQTELKRALG